ncbi:MAG: PKD domain-containing protein, partial [Dolichospermum sp.]
MKTKLRILVLTLFFSVVSSYSQNTDVWDFGATQLDNTQFNNHLNETVINSWYASSVVPGSTGVNLPVAFTAGALSWVGGTSDRLRTTNTALSRFDANIASVTSNTGRIYCNATASVSAGLPTTRYISMVLAEDDEVKIIARGDTAGSLSFANAANPTLQTDTFATTAASGTVTEVNFVAKNAGTFRIFDAIAKASFYRIYRKAATYVTVSGNINLAQAAGIPSNYSLVFTNAAGKSWTTVINSGSYSVTIPVGYAYTLSLVNASGYIISSGETLNTTGITTPTSNHNVAISGVSLYTVTGTISGLGSSISNLSLTYVPAASSGSIYVPAPVINTTNGTYTVQLISQTPSGCKDTVIKTIVVPVSTVTIVPTQTKCYSETAYLYAYGGNAYSWQPTTGLSNPTINLPACTTTANTIYTVTITQNSLYGNVCIKTLTTSMVVFPKITSDFDYTIAPCGNNVQFTDSSYTSPVSWLWNFGDINTSAQQNTSHFYNSPGIYTVSLIAS